MAGLVIGTIMHIYIYIYTYVYTYIHACTHTVIPMYAGIVSLKGSLYLAVSGCHQQLPTGPMPAWPRPTSLEALDRAALKPSCVVFEVLPLPEHVWKSYHKFGC